MTTRLPFELREAVVQVCGKAFWYKDPLKSLLVGAGVPAQLYDRYADESKYKIGRHVLAELDHLGAQGWAVQWRIVEDLVTLRGLPDEAADKDAGLAALRHLKTLARSEGIAKDREKGDREQKVEEAKRRQAAVAARATKMEELRQAYHTMVLERDDPQARGYGLEDLFADLFDLHEIPNRRPYRTPTEQIDGSFQWKGFDYLVETRWRLQPPTEAELGAFKIKVDKKLASTRGLFLSIVGFRQEVVVEVTRGTTSNIVLFDGQDLALVLEGHVSLTDALTLKIPMASHHDRVAPGHAARRSCVRDTAQVVHRWLRPAGNRREVDCAGSARLRRYRCLRSGR